MQTNWTNLGLWNRSMRLLAIWHETKIGQPQSSKFIFLLFLQFFHWFLIAIRGLTSDNLLTIFEFSRQKSRTYECNFGKYLVRKFIIAVQHKYFQSCFNNKASTIQDHLLHFLNFRILLFWSTFVSSVPFGLANQIFFPKCFSSFQQKHFFLNFHHSSPSSLGNNGTFS